MDLISQHKSSTGALTIRTACHVRRSRDLPRSSDARNYAHVDKLDKETHRRLPHDRSRNPTRPTSPAGANGRTDALSKEILNYRDWDQGLTSSLAPPIGLPSVNARARSGPIVGRQWTFPFSTPKPDIDKHLAIFEESRACARGEPSRSAGGAFVGAATLRSVV